MKDKPNSCCRDCYVRVAVQNTGWEDGCLKVYCFCHQAKPDTEQDERPGFEGNEVKLYPPEVSPEKNISNCSNCGMSWNKECGKVVSPEKEKDCCASLKQKIKEEIEKMKKKPLIYLSVKGKTVVRPAHGKPMNKINGYNQALTDLLSLIDTL